MIIIYDNFSGKFLRLYLCENKINNYNNNNNDFAVLEIDGSKENKPFVLQKEVGFRLYFQKKLSVMGEFVSQRLGMLVKPI